MARTNDTDIRSILIENDTTISTAIPIRVANRLVDHIDTCDTAGDLSVGQLEDIELFLAAHFYSITEQLISKEETEEAKAEYQGETRRYLDYTPFGQMAMVLDTTGCLTSLNEQAANGKKIASMFWAGKPDSIQTDYVNRD